MRHYVPEWPERHPDITVRQLVSHLSGIRHYDKKKEVKTEETNKETEEEDKEKSNKDGNGTERQKKRKKRNGNGSHDTEFKEFYLNRKFNSVSEALDLFKEDDLLSNPGNQFCVLVLVNTLREIKKKLFTKDKFCNMLSVYFLKETITCLPKK